MPTALTTAIVGASDRCLVGGHLQVAFRVPAASPMTTLWVLFCLGCLLSCLQPLHAILHAACAVLRARGSDWALIFTVGRVSIASRIK